MENIELKFYWYPNNDTNGVNFQMHKEYVVSEINRILNENKSRKINGFFIHFGIPLRDDRFNRIIIERGTENIFKVKEQMFSKEDYNNISSTPTFELAFKPIVEYFEKRSGINMLKRFGAFDSE
jgi:hypothetical protein